MLLGLLVEALVPDGPLVLGIDETLERRRGKKIGAKGLYRDPLLSSRERFVKTSGLRWICVVLLGRGYVGFSGLGTAVSLGVGPLRALRQRAGQAPQEADRLGLAAPCVGETLVPTARDRRRRQWHLRLSQAARPLPKPLQPDHLHYPLALGCRSLRERLNHLTPARWEDLASKVRGCRTSRSSPKTLPPSGGPSR